MSLVCTYKYDCVIADDSYGRWQYLLSSEVESDRLLGFGDYRVPLQCYNMRERKRYLSKSQLERQRIGALVILNAS